MTRNTIWSSIATHRAPSADFPGRQPSHIHLPRRRRLERPDHQAGTGATWAAHVSDEAYRGQAQPASEEA